MIRRLFVSGVIAALAALGLQAKAPQIDWGARLSMDVSFPTGKANPYKVGSGFTAGAVADIRLPHKFFFEPGIMVRYMAMSSRNPVTIDKYLYDGAAKMWSLHVPLLAGYDFYSTDNWDFAFTTGPYMNYNLSARQNFAPNLGAPVPVPDTKISLFDHGWNRVDAGWNFGLSTTFAGCYYIGFSGEVSFTPLASFGNADKKIKIYRNSIAITLGYTFD